MSLDDLSCRELVEMVTDHLEGQLDARQQERFLAHLATCPHCVRYVEQLRTTVRLTGELVDEPVAPETLEALRIAFRDWHHGLAQ
jgi:anti-sigma factor RsiW